MNDLIVYAVEGCCYCDKLIELLDTKSLSYKPIWLEKDSAVLDQVKEAYGWNTVPIIFKRDNYSFKLIGGYDDLGDLLAKGGYK